MNSLIVTIALTFFSTGLAFGIGAGTIKNTNDIVNAMIKAIQSLAGLIFLLLIISQFLAYFNYTNMSTLAALSLADILQRANLDALWLLLPGSSSSCSSSTSSSPAPCPSGRCSRRCSCRC
jgi:aminobenzoyl-glutamate transport protein